MSTSSGTKTAIFVWTTLGLCLFAAACSSSGTRRISTATQDDFWKAGSGNLDAPASADRHGCCSGHGGACGCGGGKVQCCDGVASSKCGCE